MRMPCTPGSARATSGHCGLRRASARSDEIAALFALEEVGTRCSFTDRQEIYAEHDIADSWYRVVSGAVRTCKLLIDGRRHIAQFRFPGDHFGLPAPDIRGLSAEAIGDVVLTRYPRRQTDRLIVEDPRVAHLLYNRTLLDFADVQSEHCSSGACSPRSGSQAF